MKRALSIFIIMAMMLCMLPMAVVTASAVGEEHIDLTGKADYDKVTVGDVTYSVITSAEAFFNIKNAKSGKYILANDIDLGGDTLNRPVFYDGSGFTGILNGNGYSIYNIDVDYTGTYGTTGLLFQKLGAGAKIEDLSIGTKDAPISYTVNGANVNSIGVIAGMVDAITADDTVTISGVDIYCDIVFNITKGQGVNIGGFIGYTHTAGNVDITDSTFTGSISFTEAATTSGQHTRAAGLVGYCKGGTLDVTNCVNNADIDITNRPSLDSVNYANAGGIVGRVEGNCTFTGCVNNGDMISDKSSGGIVASALKSSTFTNCVNTGNVTSDLYAGGIVGMSYFSSSSTESFEYNGCVNHGDVSAVSPTDDTRKTRAGGILGVTNSGIYKIDACGNTGNISASGVSNGKLCASGIVGLLGWITDATNSSYVTNCYSTGTIASTLENDSRTYKTYAIGAGTTKSSAEKVKMANNVWSMTFNGEAVNGGVAHNFTEDSDNNEAKNIIAKDSLGAVDAFIQKSNDNTMIRVLLLTNTAELDADTDITVRIWCGNTGKQFSVSASEIVAMGTVNAAGETYYSVDGQYIFGAVIKGIPESVMETVTEVEVDYADFSGSCTLN